MFNLEKFMEWLDREIIDTQRGGVDNLLMSGRASEAVRIRTKICQMDARDKGVDMETLEKLAEKICDKYCKFPEAYGDREDDNERMIEEKCNKCPLTELVK